MKGLRGIRQLYLITRETVTLRRLVLNRFFALILVVILVAGGTQAYVDANDDARLSGTVVDGNGDPVVNATVEMRSSSWEARFTRKTTTDENGEFLFDPYNTASERALSFSLTAAKEGLGSTRTDRMHVLFRNQSVHVDIVIDGTDKADAAALTRPGDRSRASSEDRYRRSQWSVPVG